LKSTIFLSKHAPQTLCPAEHETISAVSSQQRLHSTTCCSVVAELAAGAAVAACGRDWHGGMALNVQLDASKLLALADFLQLLQITNT
jgi:hypothetical protein